MRTLPCNSPEAAARILALSLLAAGQVSPAERNRLQQLDVDGRLGLPPGGFDEVLRQVCDNPDTPQLSALFPALLTDVTDHWRLPVPVLRSPNAYPSAGRRRAPSLVL